MSVFTDTLLRELSGTPQLDSAALKLLEEYAGLMLEANEHINLTAITDEEQVAIKHFADSLYILKYVDIPHNARLLDVGTGAGFPGIPLLIARPDLKVTLLDGTGKKLSFIADSAQLLGLKVDTVHLRAEEGAKAPEMREKFDIVTARAVADLQRLAEYCIPFVRKGGLFVAMKGADYGAELEAAKNAVSVTGGSLFGEYSFKLGSGDGRSLIIIKKISQTPSIYPRASTAISKKPL